MTDSANMPDADDYSDRDLLRVHVAHPDSPTVIRRSTLVVGSKGSGKSFLLKHQRATQHRGAFYIKLPIELSSVARDLGIGGKSEYFEPVQRDAIKGKTLALLAAAVVKLASEERATEPPLSLTLLNTLKPPRHKGWHGLANPESARAVRLEIGSMDPTVWTRAPGLSQLQDFTDQLKSHYSETPVFLLDRAEDISTPAVAALLDLMDQSVPAITVLAARPALGQLMPDSPDGSMQPGDHFDLVHLGVDPYGAEWDRFSRAAVTRYLDLVDYPDAEAVDQKWARRLARDSIKMGIRFTLIGERTASPDLFARRRQLMQTDRAMYMSRAATFLRNWVPDVRRLIAVVHQKHPSLGTGGQRAVNLLVQGAAPQFSLFSERGRLEKALQAGLRSETFFLPAGMPWHPYEVSTVVELNPMLAWNGEAAEWIR